ncbi:MAG: putative lipid II flippase FtsW [Gammaproteobacteria bacterium]
MTAQTEFMPPHAARDAHMARARGYDGLLCFTLAALLSTGVVMVYSSSIAADSATLRITPHHLLRQLAHIAAGAALMLLIARIHPDWLQRASRPLLAGCLLLLVAVLLPGIGVEVNGSVRWIHLGGLRLQPSEFAKVATVMYFADYFSRKRSELHHFRVGVLNVGWVVGVTGALLFCEPDFGATAVLAAAVAAMMFLAGVRFWHFCASIGVAGALMGALLWMEPYRVARLIIHRNPWADPFDGGFQLVQALIAIGRGEWLGAGLGNSIQKLRHLPHANTDFLAAVIGEELGAAGIFGVLILFALLLWRAFVISARAFECGQHFAGLLAQGAGLLLAIQAAVHIGVNTGMLPTKGLTLPLVSYGGSSMIASMAAAGLLLAADRCARQAAWRPA